MDFSDLGIHFKGCDKTITVVQLKTILNHYGKKFTSKDKKPELCKMVEDIIKQVGAKGPAAIAAAAALHQQGQVQKQAPAQKPAQAPAAKANYCKLNEKKTGCVKAKTAAQNDTSCMYKQSTKRCTKAVAAKPVAKAPKVVAAPKVAKKPQQVPAAKFCKLNDKKSACLLTKNAAQNDASCNYNGKRCVKAKAAAAPTPKPKTPQAQAPKPKTPQAQAPKPKTPQAQAPKPKTPQAQAPAKQLTKDEVIAKIKQCLGIAK